MQRYARGHRRSVLAAAIKRNDRWIRDKIRRGYDIYDIGPDVGHPDRSPFYQAEQAAIDELSASVTMLKG
jgi:hypothetical protein